MAITVIGTPAVVTATSVGLPTHAVGDLIILASYRGGAATQPGIPAAAGTVPTWTQIATASTVGNTNAVQICYTVAVATNHTSGTWTNASQVGAHVLRGVAGAIFGGAAAGTGVANPISAPAVTLSDSSGASYLLQFYGSVNNAAAAYSAAPANYTRLADSGAVSATASAMNSKNVTTTDGAVTNNRASGVLTRYAASQVEFLAAATRPIAVTLQAVQNAANW